MRAPTDGPRHQPRSCATGSYAAGRPARRSRWWTRKSFYVEGYFEETKLPRIHVGDRVRVTPMGGGAARCRPASTAIAAGIADRDRSTGTNLLPSVNPTFNWVRLAQRIPGARQARSAGRRARASIAGETVTVQVRRRQRPDAEDRRRSRRPTGRAHRREQGLNVMTTSHRCFASLDAGGLGSPPGGHASGGRPGLQACRPRPIVNRPGAAKRRSRWRRPRQPRARRRSPTPRCPPHWWRLYQDPKLDRARSRQALVAQHRPARGRWPISRRPRPRTIAVEVAGSKYPTIKT